MKNIFRSSKKNIEILDDEKMVNKTCQDQNDIKELKSQISNLNSHIISLKREIYEVRNIASELKECLDYLRSIPGEKLSGKPITISSKENSQDFVLVSSQSLITEKNTPEKYKFISVPSYTKEVVPCDHFVGRDHYYEIIFDQLSENKAFFRVSPKADFQRMLGLPDTYISEACDSINDALGNLSKVETIQRGELEKTPKGWRLTKKAQIKFI
ncbi:MAG: hypothetical protein RR202_11410 [Bacteroidales bacterium]